MSLTLIIGNKNYSSWSLRPWIAMKAAGIASAIKLYETGATDNDQAAKTNHDNCNQANRHILFSIAFVVTDYTPKIPHVLNRSTAQRFLIGTPDP